MPTTVQKWGNSLGLRIPRPIAEQLDLQDGSEVELNMSNGVLTVRPKRRRRRSKSSLDERLSKHKGPHPHRYLDRDPRVGRELL
jgi:antitoxin MazE